MLLLIAFIAGALVGRQRAVRRGGDRLDQLQYGAVHGIVFVLAALIVTVLGQRLGII